MSAAFIGCEAVLTGVVSATHLSDGAEDAGAVLLEYYDSTLKAAQLSYTDGIHTLGHEAAECTLAGEGQSIGYNEYGGTEEFARAAFANGCRAYLWARDKWYEGYYDPECPDVVRWMNLARALKNTETLARNTVLKPVTMEML